MTRFQEFAAGALVAFPGGDFSMRLPRAANWASASGLLLILTRAILLDQIGFFDQALMR